MEITSSQEIENIRRKSQKRKRKYGLISVLSVLVGLVIWWAVTDIFHVFPSYALPSPFAVVQGFIFKLTNKAPDNGTLFQHIWASLKIALTGYTLGAVIGVPLGICMGWFKKVDLFVTPLFDLIRPIPTIAWIPLMILWLGIGLLAKSSIVFLSAFVPCVVNSYSGIKSASKVHLWVAQTFGASNLQMLRTVAIPSALPQIFTGLRVSLGSAWTSLAAAEMLAASRGLGFMIQLNRQLARPDLIIVAMLTIGVIGASLSKLLTIAENKIIKGDKEAK